MTSRAGIFALGVLLAFYAGYRWYWWQWQESLTLSDWLLGIHSIGSVILFQRISLGAGYLCFVRPGSCDYLIDMDVELRKVVWPPVQPLFDHRAEAWGSTYVVILCTILMTVFIWITDMVLETTITHGLLRWIFS